MAHYESKHGNVHKSQAELFMMFADLSNFTGMLPAQYQASVTADYNNLTATVQGFSIGITVDERLPYERIRLISTNSPVEFCVLLHFGPGEGDSFSDFWIELDANLNLMMKAMVGGKLKDGLDKIVDGLVDASNGIMPGGFR